MNINKPLYRKLRGYALDPSFSSRTNTFFINEVVYKVPWEEAPVLRAGPAGEYVEVIDADENKKVIATPVNLNDTYILAQDGLAPSEKNLQFHQQMVYAVTMTTIKYFEKGLGRYIQWNQGNQKQQRNKQKEADRGIRNPNYVGTLKLFPHAFKEPNAYFSPDRNALLFGYFSAEPAEITAQMPNSVIYTCLSHDIIAHETTHAIIHGLYSSYTDRHNPDTAAFHEAFADMVAMFQHFTFPELIKNQVARTRGDLTNQSFLIEIAHQFGTAVGISGSLRSAIGEVDKVTKQWVKKIPTGNEYKTYFEPHQRGQILLSAIFDAFTTCYQARVADLIRIATGGSGILQQGELRPELVKVLAEEASSVARHFLKMCIRSLDYCPPIDITYGDYLRAIISADMDLVTEDKNGYRLAVAEAFGRRGIYPSEIGSLSEESLRYPLLDEDPAIGSLFQELVVFLRGYRKEIIVTKGREAVYHLTMDYIHGNNAKNITGLYERIITNEKLTNSTLFASITGLVFNAQAENVGIPMVEKFGKPVPDFEIKTLHLASRVTTEGKSSNQIIISIQQNATFRAIAYKGKKGRFRFEPELKKRGKKLFILPGGCTLVFDLDTLALRYAIRKPILDTKAVKKNKYKINTSRCAAAYRYQTEDDDKTSIVQET